MASMPTAEIKNLNNNREVYHSPNVKLICGQVDASWKDLEDFAVAIAENKLEYWLIAGDMRGTPPQLYGLHAIAETQTARRSLTNNLSFGVSLSAMLVATRRRRASHPKDMVLGMIALLDRATIKRLDLSSSLPQAEVFLRFAKHYIRNEVKECLLNHTVTEERLIGLPSWCPNFASAAPSFSIGSRWFGHWAERPMVTIRSPCAGFQHDEVLGTLEDGKFVADQDENKWAIPRKSFQAARQLTNTFSFKGEDSGIYDTSHPRQITLVPGTNYISASGVEIDTIIETVPCNPAAGSEAFLTVECIRQTYAWNQSCLALAKRTFPATTSPHSVHNVFARTICTNRASFHNPGDLPKQTMVNPLRLMKQEISEKFRRMGIKKGKRELLGDWVAADDSVDLIYDRFDEIDWEDRYLEFQRYMTVTLENGSPVADLDPLTETYAQCLCQMSKGRRFFATKGGRIGMGPSDAAPGDSVIVIFYCPTPYIVRQEEVADERNPWHFVGEAYVDGLMYGEALEMFDKGELEERKWTIG